MDNEKDAQTQGKLPRNLCLEGKYAALQPLLIEHSGELADAAADGELWNLHFTGVPNPVAMKSYVVKALEQQQAGHQHPFIIRRLSDNKIVGCTRFYAIEPEHANLAIGYTWYSKSAQRTAINTEVKLMLLEHAFEALKCISVAFHTDDQNTISQAAITRLGAKKEGVLRNHKIMPDGRIRHTWCYSIVQSEWPNVKARLIDRLARSRTGS